MRLPPPYHKLITKSIVILLLLIIVVSCKSLELTQIYYGDGQGPDSDNPGSYSYNEENTLYSLYVIGDTGLPGSVKTLFAHLSANLKNSEVPADVVLLGDNVYKWGIPLGDTAKSKYKIAYEKLNSQLIALKHESGINYFIPGNHDYNPYFKLFGNKRLKRQEEIIDANGKPYSQLIPSVDDKQKVQFIKRHNIGLILMDSEWYFSHSWWFDLGFQKRKKFRAQIKEILEQQKDSVDYFVIGAHHPIYSVGKHGLASPFHFWTKQELKKFAYSKYRKKISQIMEDYNNIIFLGGHDHSFQHISTYEGNKHHIVSGAGSKYTFVLNKDTVSFVESSKLSAMKYEEKNSSSDAKIEFATTHRGYGRLDFTKDSVRLVFFGYEEGEKNISPLYYHKLYNNP